MPVFGKVIVIRRNGSDGSQFPITSDTCVFGRSRDCDIRVQLPYVSNEQCKISMNENGEFILDNISQSNYTTVNNANVVESIKLTNKDVITIVDRSFRFEYPEPASSLKKLPLVEQQTALKEQAESPFGRLVQDMKTMIKSGTPKKRRSIIKEKKTNNSGKSAGSNSASEEARNPVKSSKSETNSIGQNGIVKCAESSGSKNDINNLPFNDSSLSVSMLDASSITKGVGTSSTVTQTDEKENIESKSRRKSSGRRSSNIKSIAEPAVNDADGSLNRGSFFEITQTSSSENPENKQRRSSRRRSSLLPSNEVSSSCSITDENVINKSNTSVDTTPTNVKINRSLEQQPERTRNGDKLSAFAPILYNSSGSTSLNSSDSINALNQGMIAVDSLNFSQTSEDSKSVKSTRRSKRFSLNNSQNLEANGSLNASFASKSKLFNSSRKSFDSANHDNSKLKNSKRFISRKHSLDSSKSKLLQSTMNSLSASLNAVPDISLTNISSDEVSKDPYDFPDEEIKNKSASKYKRRSSGSSGLSRKQTLLLFGSPRVKEVTPLRRSIGRLRLNSEPLQESEEDASPALASKNKKNWQPLPEVVEVENNSSPVKKPPLASRCSKSKLAVTPPATSTRKVGRVSFGPDLSPEQFLRELPPNTPVKKGATPAKGTKRKSVVPLETVNETPEKSFKSPDSPAKYKKVTRTPTPFKPNPTKLKSKSLLHQVLQSNMASDFKPSNDGSPKLTIKRKSADKIDLATPNEKRLKETPKLKTELTPAKKVKRLSKGNTPIKSVHKSPANLRRRSFGKANNNKPLWSEIVKKPAKSAAATKASKANVQYIQPLKKKPSKKPSSALSAKSHHVNSPATIYISRSKSRIQPTKTPRPSRTVAATKLQLPENESFSGLPELFATPVQDLSAGDLFVDLVTPQSVGEMLVSPLTEKQTSSTKKGRKSKGVSDGASPNLQKTPKLFVTSPNSRKSPRLSNVVCLDGGNSDKKAFDKIPFKHGDDNIDMLNSSTISIEKSKLVDNQLSSKKILQTPPTLTSAAVNEDVGTKKLSKAPKVKTVKNLVDDQLDTKRLIGSPRESKAECIEENLGTFKTPKEKNEVVEDNFGTKRLFKNPKEQKSELVEEHLGTKRIFKTPRGKKGQPVDKNFGLRRIFHVKETEPGTLKEKKDIVVEDNFGTERLFKSPKEQKSELIEEHLGTKRMFKTPRGKKGQPVDKNFGLGRIFHVKETKRETPKENKDTVVEYDFGTKRLFNSPKEQKSESVEEQFGTKRIFKTPRGKKNQPLDKNLYLERLFDFKETKRRKISGISDSESLNLNILFPDDLQSDKFAQLSTESTKIDIVQSPNIGIKAKITRKKNERNIRVTEKTTRSKTVGKVQKGKDLDKPSGVTKSNNEDEPIKTVTKRSTKRGISKNKELSSSDSNLSTEAPRTTRRGVKHVTFHVSVAPAQVNSGLVETDEPISKRARISRIMTEEPKVTRRGRSKAAIVTDQTEPASKNRGKKGKNDQDVERLSRSKEVVEKDGAESLSTKSRLRKEVSQQVSKDEESSKLESSNQPSVASATPKRGRSRKGSASAESNVLESSSEASDTTTNTRRGRSKKVSSQTDFVQNNVEIKTEVAAKPTLKRVRSASKVVRNSENSTSSNDGDFREVVNVKPVQRRGRSRQTVEPPASVKSSEVKISEKATRTVGSKSEEIKVEGQKNLSTEKVASTAESIAPPTPRKGRGRKATKAPNTSEIKDKAVDDVKVSKTATRSRRGRLEVINDDQKNLSTKKVASTAECIDLPTPRKGRGRKATRAPNTSEIKVKDKAVDDVNVTKTTTRSRRGRLEVVYEGLQLATKKSLEKIASETNDNIVPSTPRKGRLRKAANPSKITETKESSAEESNGSKSATEPATRKGRSRQVAQKFESADEKGKEKVVSSSKKTREKKSVAAKTEPVIRRSSRRK